VSLDLQKKLCLEIAILLQRNKRKRFVDAQNVDEV